MSVAYTYENDLLTEAETPTTAYTFTYGTFGLAQNVKIGSRTLASYTYTNDRNFYLSALDYGNGHGVQYTYDESTGLFQTVAGVITVPAATYEQDIITGKWNIIPGVTILTVTGTV